MDEEIIEEQNNSENTENGGAVETAENTEKVVTSEKKEKKKLSRFQTFVVGMAAGVVWVLIVFLLATAARGLISKVSLSKKVSTTNTDTVVDSNTVTKIKTLEALIDTYYYEDVDKEALENGLYQGLMDAVGDRYTRYYTAEELTKQEEDMNGTFQGIGAYLSTNEDYGYPEISGVMEGTPAEEAGLMDGDIIYKVDGEDVRSLDLDEVVRRVRGEEGTTVELTLVRNGEEIVVNVERREITSRTVSYGLLEGNIAYIDIARFDDATPDQFKDALAEAKEDNAVGLIVDLRSNPGGNLDAVVDICNMICPKGLIVYTEDKYGKREEYFSDGKNEIDIPMVVLINQYSASASEIFAGAVKDYGIGTLVGVTTYGKGIVQSVIPLNDGSAIKLTVSKYYTPNGVNIHGVGIEPDVEVEFDVDKYLENEYDSQLEEGIKVINEKLAE